MCGSSSRVRVASSSVIRSAIAGRRSWPQWMAVATMLDVETAKVAGGRTSITYPEASTAQLFEVVVLGVGAGEALTP